MPKELLAKGYFPHELPPPFHSRDLSLILDPFGNIVPTFNSAIPGKLVVHNLARTGSLRRKLSIPNPINYAKLARDLTTNYQLAEIVYNKSKFSRSRPIFGGDRAFSRKVSMSELPLERIKTRSGKRYVVKTDISKCYPSIYTHSIPWAIHTKPFAKSNYGLNHWGNSVDKNVRDAQDKQTIGIPIGPDTSFLIAELILSDVDEKISNKMPGAKGMRYIDDYEFCFSSMGESEEFLGILQSALGDYELVVNPQKTSIVDLPIPSNAVWASELQVFSIRSQARAQLSDLIRYFDRSLELSKEFKDENVLKYSVSRLQSIQIDIANWPLVEGVVLQIMALEAGAMSQGLKLFKVYESKNYPINKSGLEEVLNEIISRHLPQGYGSELAWAIWGCIEFGLMVSADNGQKCLDF